mmetsp:Transcript_79953/g.244438  ORF Transcript_79953/g.244438 Transcript_79953/m.244438 type:complete len:231 (-) Transcript_79953:2491-3183(-)
MVDRPALAPESEIHAGENVLRKVQRLGGLGHTALLHHVHLVHDVWVAIMHSRAQRSVAPLKNRAEGHLCGGREVADGADVASDVLREADDLLGPRVAARARPELAERARQQERLLEVPALIRVDALGERPPHERDGVVLVVALAVPEDGVARQLDLVPRALAAVGALGARAVDQAAEIPATLSAVHAVHFRGDVLLRRVDVRDLEARRKGVQHPVCLVELLGREAVVQLH